MLKPTVATAEKVIAQRKSAGVQGGRNIIENYILQDMLTFN